MTSDDTRQPTHTSMRGGKFCISSDKNLDFIELYVKAYTSNTSGLSLIELATPVTKFYFDFDLKGPMFSTLNELKVYHAIQNSIRKFFPSQTITTLCDLVITQVKNEVVDGKLKVGRHGYAPYCYVTATQSRLIRLAALSEIEALSESIPSLKRTHATHNSWNDAFDEAVYGRSLRMALSSKTQKCRLCRNDPSSRENCNECTSTGFVDLGRVYTMKAYIRSNGHIDGVLTTEYKDNRIKFLDRISIRSDLAPEQCTRGFTMYPGCPQLGDPANLTDLSIGDTVVSVFKEDAAVLKRRRNLVRVPTQSEKWGITRTILHRIPQPEWKHVMVQTITTNKVRDASYTVTVKGAGASFCKNYNRNHNSNSIYFVISKKYGVKQFCYCRCETTKNRRYGQCKNFSQQVLQLTRAEHDVLWPQPVINISAFNNADMAETMHAISRLHQQRNLLENMNNSKAPSVKYKSVNKKKRKRE